VESETETAPDGDEPRPIEAALAHAVAWGAPVWILDHDGPPPPKPVGANPDWGHGVFGRMRRWLFGAD
jgi:hypothetical protein